MIEDFTDSAIIIDDKEGDIEGLQNVLTSKGFLHQYFQPEDIKKRGFKFKKRKLIFLDLYLEPGLQLPAQISMTIKNIFKKSIGKNFGTYGIILWSRHTEETEEGNTQSDLDIFREKLSLASQQGDFTPPLFIVGMQKTNYLTPSGYQNIFSDLEMKLKENTAASFFINWSIAIERSKNNTITNIFSLAQDYAFQDDNLKFLLYHLAKNKTGIGQEDLATYPLYEDAYKAFSELLVYDIGSKIKTFKCELFSSLDTIKYHKMHGSDKISKDFSNQYYKNDRPNLPKTERPLIDNEIAANFSFLNTQLLIEENPQHQNIIPGNIYIIKHDKSIFISDKLEEGDTPILIEMTAPCDFANPQKKGHPKVVGGFITNYSEVKKKIKSEAIYTEPHPLQLKGYTRDQMIIFDFRYIGILNEKDLLNPKKYKLKYRAKDNLFADVLQKLSAHIARLGLAVLHH